MIALTPAVEDVFDRLMTIALKRNAAFVRGIGENELATFSIVLDRMTANARALLADEQNTGRQRGRAAAGPSPLA